jgi:hypothetical protein
VRRVVAPDAVNRRERPETRDQGPEQIDVSRDHQRPAHTTATSRSTSPIRPSDPGYPAQASRAPYRSSISATRRSPAGAWRVCCPSRICRASRPGWGSMVLLVSERSDGVGLGISRFPTGMEPGPERLGQYRHIWNQGVSDRPVSGLSELCDSWHRCIHIQYPLSHSPLLNKQASLSLSPTMRRLRLVHAAYAFLSPALPAQAPLEASTEPSSSCGRSTASSSGGRNTCRGVSKPVFPPGISLLPMRSRSSRYLSQLRGKG